MRPKPSALQRELKQTKPFRSPAEAAILGVLRTADVIRGELEHALEPCGVTLQQYNVLRILRGSHPAPLPTLEIADRMIERAPGITRLLDRLEAAGQVSRQRCRADRRRVLCSITPAGLATLDDAAAPLQATGHTRAQRLSRADMLKLQVLLDRLRGAAK